MRDWWDNNGWQAISSWLSSHGWRILLIVVVASLIRRFGMIFVGKLIERSINKSERFETDRDRKLRTDTVISMVGSILKVATWIAVGLLVLSEMNVLKLLAPILAGAGVLSLLLGFGIQTFIRDFISGMFVVSENQYRVGDIVLLNIQWAGEVEGRVIRITLRTTVLRDEDGTIHVIPNGNILRAANLTLDFAKVNVEIALPLGADFEAAEIAINKLGQELNQSEKWREHVILPAYFHGVQTIDKENATIEVRAKTLPAEQWEYSSELKKQLAELVFKEKMFVKGKRRNNSQR